MSDDRLIAAARHRIVMMWIYIIMANIVDSRLAVAVFAVLAAVSAFRLLRIAYRAVKAKDVE